LIVALLERGQPMTLVEVAERFTEAGIARAADAALASLQRCRPARAPVYRDGDRYALDPHDDDLDLWAFRLGLRPPKALPRPPREPAQAAPLPPLDAPLSVDELKQAWRECSLYSWSAQRVAMCVLDAHGKPLAPDEVVAFVAAQTEMHPLHRIDGRWGRPSPIAVREDGRWALEPAHPRMLSARKAVRDRLVLVRKWAAMRPDPAVIEANRRAFEERRPIARSSPGRGGFWCTRSRPRRRGPSSSSTLRRASRPPSQATSCRGSARRWPTTTWWPPSAYDRCFVRSDSIPAPAAWRSWARPRRP
jgi:hypothetical protein